MPHTKGPWSMYGQNDVFYIEENGIPEETLTIATVEARPDQKANASLIVAAPDMYLAIEYILLAYNHDEPIDAKDAQYLETILAKARGTNV